jgi:hypothetical protein
MSFDSKLLEIDPETGDLKQTNKKRMGDYLSRRSKAQVETPVQNPEQPTTVDYPTGQPDEYTYTPPKENAYPIESNPDVKQSKFAKEFQMARWTFPETLPITRALTNIDNPERAFNPKSRKHRGEMLKDIITIQDVLPDPIDTLVMIQNGESPLPEINPVSLAMQAEIGIKLTKNRFSKTINPTSEPGKHQNNIPMSQTVKETTPETRADSSTWISRSKAYRGKSQQTTSHKLAAEQTPVLLTDSYQRALSLYNQEDSNPKVNNTIKSKLVGRDGTVYNGRISKTEVAEIESRLESQYVPFYFHDLRTNEILNFHAFVNNVSDSYTSNWNDSDGYGRMDPVQTYKNTTRSIALDFYVVSTSEKDFDRVWWTINRLVMMLYPQWSKGNELKGQMDSSKDTYKFLQPFSQTITASPLIRLRVGDLIASNYSRFNLARNFGMGLADMYIKEPANSEFKSNVEINDALEIFLSTLKESSFSIDSPVEPLLINARQKINPDAGQNGIEIIFASTVTLEQGTGFIKPSAGLRSTTVVKRGTKGVVLNGRRRSDGTITVVVKLNPLEKIKVNTLVAKVTEKKQDDDGPNASEIEYVAVNPEVLYCVQAPAQPPSPRPPPRSSQVIQSEIDSNNAAIARNREIIASRARASSIITRADNDAQLRILDLNAINSGLQAELSEAVAYENGAVDRQQRELINENFLNANEYLLGDKGNSIVRSFEDSGGRGLAGSIRSLSFDWNEAPWETSVGSRAPIWCKVSLQFNPIHDLPMGLDHEGMPRAVPYPVGETVRQAYFPELNEQSKKERVSQVADTTKFWDAVADKAEGEINGYLGKSLKRLF